MNNVRPNRGTRPRLGQPLFSKKYGELYNKACDDPIVGNFILAYDQIFNLLYYPMDMETKDIFRNAEITLDRLGRAIEQAFGEQVFKQKKMDDGQLSFEFEQEPKQQGEENGTKATTS